MDESRLARGVAATGGWARRLHHIRISSQQRLHLAAFLTLILLSTPLLAGDIGFDPSITQEDFRTFSRLAAQGIFPTPVNPPGGTGILSFDIGLAATGVPIDTNASYWRKATAAAGNDFSVGGYIAVPRIVVSKGIGAAAISASYARVQDTGATVVGATADLPIISGGLVSPTLALRASYGHLDGADVYKLSTYGLELLLGKGFGPITPYGGIGMQRGDAKGIIPATSRTPEITLTDQSNLTRYTLGARLSMAIVKLTVEATQAEERSYSAKVSFGF